MFRNVVRVLAAVAFSVVVLIAGCIGGMMLQYPVRAATWHCIHGNEVMVGNRQLTLPLLWWRGKDIGSGSIVLRRGRIDSRLAFATSELTLTKLKDVKAVTDADGILGQNALLADLNRGRSKQTAFPLIVASPAGRIYCVKDLSIPNFSFLFCLPTGARWNFVFGPGTAKEESEAESMLATLK